MRRDIRPVAEKLGITNRIGWHTFRHYADLLTIPGEPWIELTLCVDSVSDIGRQFVSECYSASCLRPRR
jgi:hypothetical protein